MKRIRLIALIIINLFLFKPNLFSQILYTAFSEGFEHNGAAPPDWNMEWPPFRGTVNWIYRYGGHTNALDPDNYPLSRKPVHPHTGNYNAMFEVQSISNEATKLVTPQITGLKDYGIHPMLRFWNAQGFLQGTDQLRVYFKTRIDSAWVLLQTYIDPTETFDSVYWVQREIYLPTNRLSNTYYIAFEGTTKWGYGTCIDDVSLVETGSTTKTLKSVTYNQPVTDPIPLGTEYNQIIRVDLKVAGNTGSLKLNSFAFDGLNSDNTDIATSGVKLYYTSDSTFSPKLQLGTSQDFTSGNSITFSGLNYELPYGASYLWVTYDIKSNAAPNHFVDAVIKQNGININGATYPSADVSPPGRRELYETIFMDDFEGDKGWVLSGEFQRTTPMGLGGSMGGADPSNAFSGNNVLGTDLTGLGDNPGDYEKSLNDYDYEAISPTVNLKYYNNLQLSFYKWINIENDDQMTIDYSIDNGTAWTRLWKNDGTILESKWTQQQYHLPADVERQPQVKFRFTLGQTGSDWQLSGWNIDNFILTGDHITNDVGATTWLGPNETCSMPATSYVSVRVRNFADGPSKSIIPIGISLDNGATFLIDTIHYTIPKDGTYDFTFTKPVDFSKADIYKVIVKTISVGDKGPENDAMTKHFYSFPTQSIPYADYFDEAKVFWKSEGKNYSWELGVPEGVTLNPVPSSPNVWITLLKNDYYSSDSSWVVSPCFNFTNINQPVIDFKYWNQSEAEHDGTVIQYSTNGGSSWQDVPKHGYSQWKWNWYNDNNVAALGGPGWDTTTISWFRARQFLPAGIVNNTQVRFRFKFESDALNPSGSVLKGFAFDDFRIYNAPYDVGVDSIVNISPVVCQDASLRYLNLNITNYGVHNLQVNDTMIVGVKVNHGATIIDTFKLSTAILVGQTKQVTLNKAVPIINSGNYTVEAFTMLDMEPNYYNTDNDMAELSFSVNPYPVTGLKKSYSTARLDTLVLIPATPAGYNYSWEHNSSTATTQTYLASDIGTYRLTVENPVTHCISKDTINVFALHLDAGVSQIVAPGNSCSLGTAFKPIVKIKNFGSDTLAVKNKVPLKIRLNTGSIVVDSIKLTKALAPDSSVTVALNTAFNLSVAGTYQLMVKTNWAPYDIDLSNDSTKVSFSIYGMPTVELDSNLYSKTLSYTLVAPIGYSSYLWNDNSTNDTLIVTQSGKYVVTVKNANGCFAKDSVNVMLSIHDLSIKRVISPLTFCSKPGLSTISCEVMNNGTDTIKTSETPVMSYHLNSGALVTQNLVLSGNLLPGDSVTFTFTQKEDIHLPSTNTFLIKATVGNDLVRANDSVTNIVKVYQNPVISLGQVTQSYNNVESYPLSPGSGYASYLWQDGSTNPVYLITQTHYSKSGYSVVVTDAFGCKGGDTVYVSLIVKDIRLDSIYLPDETCATSLPLKIKVTNTGNVAIDQDVSYTYSVNGAETQHYFHFTADTSTKSQDFTLKDPLDFSTTGVRKIMVTLQNQGEVRKSNDTLTQFINAKKGVNINFGTANDTLKVDLPYTLDPGSGSNYSYTWSTSAITQTITVSTNNLYTVTVTNGICTDSKSVRVIDNIYDFAISYINVPGSKAYSICKSAQKQTATFDIQNNGSVNFSNEPITIKYKLNSGAETSKTINFSGGNLVKNTYPLDDLDLSQVRIDTIRLNLEYAKDKISSNDSIKQYLLNILEIPTINFVGAINDTIKATSSSVVLDPASGSGYSYLWIGDGSEYPTLVLTNNEKWQAVTVSNDACEVKDSVYVTFPNPVHTISKQATLITFPNPVQDVLHIDLSVKTSEEITLEFISSLGTIVKTDKLSGSMRYVKIIDVSNLPKGLYYLKLHRKDWVMIEKIIIQ